jgi:zinc protease
MRMLGTFATLAIASILSAQAPATAPSISPETLKFPPLRQVQIPNVATFTLPNGMRLYLLENHELPLVSGFALVKTGNLFEPADKVGLAEITGEVMRSGGTKAKSGDDIDVELENMAASVESGIGETSGSVGFSALKDNADQVMAIFRDVLAEPAFRQDKIDLIKNQVRGMIARRNDDAGSIASREFAAVGYGRNTPYGRQTEYEHLDRIGRDDLVAFHSRYFFPANVMLAVQGDFDTVVMKQKIEKLFETWRHAQTPVPAFPPVTKQSKPGIYVAEKDDVNQTFFSLGHMGGVLSDPDYPALEVMSDILGGGFSSRLFKKVRTQLGYAYSIGGGWGAEFNHPGLFRIAGSTKTESTAATLDAIRKEIELIRTSEVTDQELNTAKETVANSFVFRFDRPSKILNRLVTYDYYGYPKDFIFRHQKAVAATTKADILRVAKEHLKPDSVVIVAVGKVSDFKQSLSTLKLPVSAIDLSIPEAKRSAAPSDGAAVAGGRAILRRAQQAVGGTEKLAQVKDYVVNATAQLSAGAGAMKVKQTNQWVAPAFFRQDQELPFGKMVAYSDGSSSWLAGPQGTQPMPPQVLKQVQTELFRNFFRLLLSDRDADRSLSATGENAVRVSGGNGMAVTLILDKTGLPQKQQYSLEGREVEESYADWKEVDGVRLPFTLSLEQGGRKSAEITITEWKLNTGLKPEDLQRKP